MEGEVQSREKRETHTQHHIGLQQLYMYDDDHVTGYGVCVCLLRMLRITPSFIHESPLHNSLSYKSKIEKKYN